MNKICHLLCMGKMKKYRQQILHCGWMPRDAGDVQVLVRTGYGSTTRCYGPVYARRYIRRSYFFAFFLALVDVEAERFVGGLDAREKTNCVSLDAFASYLYPSKSNFFKSSTVLQRFNVAYRTIMPRARLANTEIIRPPSLNSQCTTFDFRLGPHPLKYSCDAQLTTIAFSASTAFAT